MKIDIMVVTYLRGGGKSPYHYIGDLLSTRLEEYGTAVNTIEIYPRLAVPEGTLPGSADFDRWQAALEKLPYVSFRRKLKRFELAFRSNHFDASDMDDWQGKANGIEKLNLGTIGLASLEINDALQLIRKRLKPADDFDVVRFLADVKDALNSAPQSIEEWSVLRTIADERRKEVQAASSVWDQLDIDWSQYHPDARQILDDPFYWDCLDDISPHGNDTGADLLEDFQKWNRRKLTESPLRFLEKVSRDLNVQQFDWSLTEMSQVLKIDHDRHIEMGMCNEVAIALAFAVLKMRASCPAEIVELANCALERTSILVNASRMSDAIKTEWDDGIKRMKSKLQSSTQ